MSWSGTGTNASCTGCNDGSISLSVTGSSPTYLWNIGATTQNISNLSAGYYYCTVTNASGCKVFPSFVVSQNLPSTPVYFQNVYGTGSDIGNSVFQTADSGFIVAGSRNNIIYLQKTDKAGYVQWSHTYNKWFDGATCGTATAYSIKQTNDGGYLITGTCSADVLLLKVNSVGVDQWRYTLPVGGGTDNGYSVIQTSDSGYALTGNSGNTKVAIAKFNSSGTLLWAKDYSAGSTNGGKSIIQTTDGSLLAAGAVGGGGSYGLNMGIIKTDNSGNFIGALTYGGTTTDEAYSIQQTSDGGLIIAGYTNSFGAGNSDVYLIKTAANGNVQWSKTFGETDVDIAYSVKPTPDGGYIILGETKNFGSGWGNSDIYLLKTDATGNLQWAKVYGGYQNEQAREIQVCVDGGYVIVGTTYSYGTATNNIYLLRTDANGNVPGCEPLDVTALTQVGNPATVTYIPTLTETSFTTQNTEAIRYYYADAPRLSPSISTAMSSTGESACQSSDGSAAVSATSGSAPYAYYWSTGGNTSQISNLTSQIYSVTVTDSKGCAKRNSISVSGFIPPSIAVSTIGESACQSADGIAALTISGGTSPFNFNWSNGDTVQNLSGLSAGNFFVTVTDSTNCTAKDTAVISGFIPPAITLTGVNPTGCGSANGAVILNISGGQTPFVYQWNTGAATQNITNRPAGVYAVSITDANGCLVSGNATLNDPSSLSIIVTSTDDTICGGSNGSASLTASGGSSPYTYQWSNGSNQSAISNLQSATYSVTVTDNVGCARTSYAVINAPQSLILTSATTQANCNVADGSATITASGGTNPYIYHWSNGSTNSTNDSLTAGIYVVTVTDSLGCSGSSAVAVSNSSGLTVVPSVTNVLCHGASNGNISLSVSGGSAPYTYSWSHTTATAAAAANLSAGPYEIIVTDNDTCIVTQTINVSQPAPITVSINTSAATCGTTDGSASATPSGGASPYTYSWSSGGTTNVEAALGAGIYAVQVNDSNGCVALASAVIGETGAPLITAASVVPNTCGSSGGSIAVNVSGGVLPYSYLWNNGESSDAIYGVSSGTYTLTVTGSNGCKAIASYNLAGIQPQLQPVCLVSTAPNNNNVVVYERVQQTGISHYTIYRETTQAGVYQLAATIPFSQLSQFTDINSNAQVRSYRYKIGAVDTCGNESLHSPPHQTIHLTANQGLGNVVNLIWNHYSGFNFSTYFIWRWKQSTGWVKIDSLPSNLSSYTDTTAGTGSAQYFVEAKPSFNCTSTTKSSVDYNSSRSNVKAITNPGSTISATVNTMPDGGSCNGTATATPVGGQSPYTYQWNGATPPSGGWGAGATVTGLCAGNYTVTVTDVSGDFAVQNFTIVVCPAPVADFAATQTSGNAPLSVDFFDMSANNPNSLAWTFFGATPLNSTLLNPTAITYNTAGTFSVKLEVFNSCGSNSIIKNGFITVNSSGGSTLTATATATADSGSCNGTATAIANGGITPYTYLWSDSAATTTATATNLCTGVYTVTITDSANNNYVATVQVSNVNTCLAPVSDFAASQTSGNAPLSIDFFDLTSNAPDSVSWTFFGAIPLNSILQNPSGITYNNAGTYSVKLQSYNNCGNDVEIKSGYITVLQGVDVEELQVSDFDFQIYPNPNDGTFTLEILNDELRRLNFEVKIYNVLGEIVYQKPITDYRLPITLKQPQGIYNTQIRTQNKISNQKIIVE